MAPGARDDAEGVAAPGSLRLDGYGVWRFRWSVAAGRRTVSAKVKQPVNVVPRPQLAVLPNPAIGVAVEVTADAPAGTDWVDIGPITFTPDVAGVVWVELRALYDAPVPCWWDDVTLQ
jgi:hypothetical protein